MKKGLAPLVKLDGQLYSMELHHPNGKNGYAIFDFIPLTPWGMTYKIHLDILSQDKGD